MSFVRYLWTLLGAIVKALAYEWILALIALVKRLCAICRRWRSRRKAGRAAKASASPCNPIDRPAFHRPDPMIYAQYDLMAKGYAITWDNPDIELRKGGVVVSSTSLDPSTEYEVVARIWNKSTDAPVVAMPVYFSYLSYGNGKKSNPIGATAVNLGVKGGPNHPAFATMKWTTPAAKGMYCLQILLAPADDLDFKNNLGQENTKVIEPKSPATLEFQLRNENTREQTFRFEIDTYRLPPRPPCGEQHPPGTGTVPAPPTPVPPPAPPTMGPQQPPTAVKIVPPEHDRRNYPIPPGWNVAVDPATPALAAGAETTIQVTIDPPAGFHGRQTFNVNAFDADGFTGGVTVIVEAP